MNAVAAASAYKLEVEQFSIYDGETNLHYEADEDLYVETKKAQRGGIYAGLVLVELGIEGYDTHRVRVDTYPTKFKDPESVCDYDRSNVDALSDAVRALTAIVDQLRAMQTAEAGTAGERNAFELGVDYGAYTGPDASPLVREAQG